MMDFTFPPPPPPPPPTTTAQNYDIQSRGLNYGNYPGGQGRGRGPSYGGGLRGSRGGLRGGGYSGQRFNTYAPKHNNHSSQASGQNYYHNSARGPWKDPPHAPTKSNFNDHSQKRSYKEAFRSASQTVPNSTAPPATPSFGLGLPSEFLALQSRSSSARIEPAPKKKPRQHNQLGLTPRTEVHESSEDDLDEEAKLAIGTNVGQDQLFQFSYKGQLSTLSSPAEIAAWIEERRKRFPTKAKTEEGRAKAQELAQLRAKAKETQRLGNEKLIRKTCQQRDPVQKSEKADAARKANCEADKLRERLENARNEVAAIEAKIRSSKILPEETDSTNERLAQISSDIGPDKDNSCIIALDSGDVANLEIASENGLKMDIVDLKACYDNSSGMPSNLLTSDRDETSSNGSSSKDQGGSSNDDDVPIDVPTEISSKRNEPEWIPPANLTAKKQRAICKEFLHRGRCSRKLCHYRHHLPQNENVSNDVTPSRQKLQGRQSLYQRLLSQQRDQDAEVLLQHVVYLGNQGLLDEPESDKSSDAAAART